MSQRRYRYDSGTDWSYFPMVFVHEDAVFVLSSGRRR